MSGPEKHLQGQSPDEQDYLRYFRSYSFISHQRSMLEDHKRTTAYYHAIVKNRRQFEGKVVLDVGTGSGILAMFAARAGARKVYAVEATSMAEHARKLVEVNQLQNIVTVIQGTMETVELPEKVDIIVSEWMGYLLLRETMLDSVLVARDRFLKPGGAMYPSHARLFWAPIKTEESALRKEDYDRVMEHWEWFLLDMKNLYDIDMDVLSQAYIVEQKQKYLGGGEWAEVHPDQLLSAPVASVSLDMHQITIDELKAGVSGEGVVALHSQQPIEAICGWFDVSFRGSPENPADNPIELDTAPDAQGATHWGQTVFMIQPPLQPQGQESVSIRYAVFRREDYARLLRVQLHTRLASSGLEHKQEFGVD
ncbi:MAG: 50S ribosomal protein L11 methyltransferase [Pseudobdellovibrionaceae bacterium]|nr:50S ribosomal protein L11 methyltransferase [Pseudobdellovibrionaceae bacterium]